MNHKLLLMCGVPGSGKSTLAKKIAESCKTTVTYVSRDDIRFKLLLDTETQAEFNAAFANRENADTEEKANYIQEHYFKKEKEVYREFINAIKAGLTSSDLTIADATHLNELSRAKLLRALGDSLKDVEVNVMVVKVSLDTAVAHNENRRGSIAYVPLHSIKNMYDAFTMPSLEEGFDNIYIYEGDNNG